MNCTILFCLLSLGFPTQSGSLTLGREAVLLKNNIERCVDALIEKHSKKIKELRGGIRHRDNTIQQLQLQQNEQQVEERRLQIENMKQSKRRLKRRKAAAIVLRLHPPHSSINVGGAEVMESSDDGNQSVSRVIEVSVPSPYHRVVTIEVDGNLFAVPVLPGDIAIFDAVGGYVSSH